MKLPTMRALVLAAAVASLYPALRAQQQITLPEPFATASASNQSRVVPKPADAALKAPTGFAVSVYASNVPQARIMVWSPNGDLFVARSRAGASDVFQGGDSSRRVEYATGLQ